MDQLNKAALEPFANALNDLLSPLHEMDDGKLRLLLSACNKAHGTNCWFRTYEVAQMMKKEIASIILERGKRSKSAMEG